MHFHLPKPLHGWREFAAQVGIIVIGVLIALTFEQVAEAMRWRSAVIESEASMRKELAEDDGPQHDLVTQYSKAATRVSPRARFPPIADRRGSRLVQCRSADNWG
jgi:hypothetical protein